MRAVAKGWKASIADPEGAVKMMVTRNPAADVALETRRLQLAIDANVMTDYVAANGMGSIDEARFAEALEQLKSTMGLSNVGDASLYFDASYLPDDGSLMLK